MRKELISIGSIVLLFVLLSGCGENSSEKSENNESSFSTYENMEKGISIEYPSTWNKYENPPQVPDVTVLFSSVSSEPTKTGSLMITVLDEVNLLMDEFKEAHIENSSLLLPDFELVAEESTILSGLQGYKIIFTFTSNLYTWRQLEVWTINENILYLLVHQADQAYYENFVEDIEHMISSFEIRD